QTKDHGVEPYIPAAFNDDFVAGGGDLHRMIERPSNAAVATTDPALEAEKFSSKAELYIEVEVTHKDNDGVNSNNGFNGRNLGTKFAEYNTIGTGDIDYNDNEEVFAPLDKDTTNSSHNISPS